MLRFSSLILLFSSLMITGRPAFTQVAGTLAPPLFSKTHGYFDTPFDLEIKSSDNSASIYYTIDGSQPAATSGILYKAPLLISGTSVVRAVCVKDNLTSKTTTRSYIFPDDVINQSNKPSGYPATWGPYTGIAGVAQADYEMDPEIMSDPQSANLVKDALASLPVISLATNKGYLFSQSQDRDTGGIYIYTGPPLTNTTNGLGFGWERPVSFEYFDSKASVSIQVDCGIQLQGGHGRRPEKSPKHSFRLVFKSIYGPGKLKFPLFGDKAVSEFNTLVLRAGFGNTWVHWSHNERSMSQYMRDRWTKDTHADMGHLASRGNYVHLFINGLYWGIYNPSERLDKEYAASYLKGNPEDYDVIKDYAELVDGSTDAWNKAISMANAGLSGNDAYLKFIGRRADGSPDPNNEAMVDPVSLADYMILNFYGGNWDWDHHNWVAIRNRVKPDKGFQFFCWDGEHMADAINSNVLTENNNNCPSRIYQQMLKNPNFKRLIADRVQKFCFNEGALTPEKCADRWTEIGKVVGKAIDSESARWGDYRRDVHPWQTEGPFMLYTKTDHWIPQMNYMLDSYFPSRTDIFLAQLRAAKLFPATNAPVFVIDNKPVGSCLIKPGEMLTIISDNGSVYYTTDGSDPVVWGTVPAVAASAKFYSAPIKLNRSTRIKAVKVIKGEWSATNDQLFTLAEEFFIPGDNQEIDRTALITIYQNYPNPFTEITKLPYELNEGADIEIAVIDLNGRKVATLEKCHKESGLYVTEWNGRNSENIPVASGVYLFRFDVRKGNEWATRSYKAIVSR